MTLVNTTEEADAVVMSIVPFVEFINDEAGLQVISEEGLPITIEVMETTIEITPEGINVEGPDISIEAVAGIELVASATVDITAAGAAEIEAADISISGAAIELEAALVTAS